MRGAPTPLGAVILAVCSGGVALYLRSFGPATFIVADLVPLVGLPLVVVGVYRLLIRTARARERAKAA